MFYSVWDPLLYFNFIYFILTIFIAFFIPGDVLIRKEKLGSFERMVVATLLGLGLFIFQGFLLGYLGLRFLSYLFLASFVAMWLYQRRYLFLLKFQKLQITKRFVLLSSVIILGVLLQVSTMWFTGIRDSDGIFICCGNSLDSLFHAALTHQIIKDIPPLQPGMFPVPVSNYHYLSNLVVADLVRIFHLPLIPTLFQYMTIFISLFLGLGAVAFCRIQKMSFGFTGWLLFFLYFGGDFIYLALILAGNSPSFRMGALEHGGIFLVNPPRAYAVVLFFGFLALFAVWLKNKKVSTGILYALIAATLVGLKVYIGIFTLFGLSVLAFLYLIRQKISYLVPIIIAGIGSLFFYLPVNRSAGGFYFTGFWLFENFIVQSEFNLGRMELARNVYKDHGNVLRVIQYEVMYIAFYIFSIFGTKIIGLFQTKKSLSFLPKEIHIVLLSGIFISTILGFFFQQESGGANSFNFVVSIFILGSIYSALALTYWLSMMPKLIALIVALIIILLTLPRVSNQFLFNIVSIIEKRGDYIVNSQQQIFSKLQMESNNDSLIMVDPQFSDFDDHSPFISFITDRKMFLSGRGILESHNILVEDRVLIRKTILHSSNRKKVANLLRKNKITHIIVPREKELLYLGIPEYTDNVFENDRGRILKIVPKKLDEYIKLKKYEEPLEK